MARQGVGGTTRRSCPTGKIFGRTVVNELGLVHEAMRHDRVNGGPAVDVGWTDTEFGP